MTDGRGMPRPYGHNAFTRSGKGFPSYMTDVGLFCSAFHLRKTLKLLAFFLRHLRITLATVGLIPCFKKRTKTSTSRVIPGKCVISFPSGVIIAYKGRATVPK